MNIQTCQFVHLSDLFDGLSALFAYFQENEYQVTWGSANRTMINQTTLSNMVADAALDAEETILDTDIHSRIMNEYEQFKARIMKLDNDVYIDLEN